MGIIWAYMTYMLPRKMFYLLLAHGLCNIVLLFLGLKVARFCYSDTFQFRTTTMIVEEIMGLSEC